MQLQMQPNLFGKVSPTYLGSIINILNLQKILKVNKIKLFHVNIYLRIISLILITYSISYFTCMGRNQVTTMSNYILINLMVTLFTFRGTFQFMGTIEESPSWRTRLTSASMTFIARFGTKQAPLV